MNAKPDQGIMDTRHGKNKRNVQLDRLSSLPDELIHKILSFISMRQAIEIPVLSSRWRFIWISMPYLNFEDCHTSSQLSKFASNVLRRCNNQAQVSSLKLVCWDPYSHQSARRILNYAVSHNVQQLTVTCKINVGCPCSRCNCQSPDHQVRASICAYPLYMETATWDLPALTTLHLDHISLSDNCTSLFSKCTNLRNLSLCRFRVRGSNVNIFHPRLSNLTLEYPNMGLEVVNVVTPCLKNLTIIYVYVKLLISAPGLTSLVMKGSYPLQISAQDFPCLEKVDLGPFCPGSEITCDLESNFGVNLSLFSSPSLKHLVLSGALCESFLIMARPTWNLPALTTLHLDEITLSDEYNSLFSKCTNLKNLSLSKCKTMGTDVLYICHPGLSNLTLQDTYWSVEALKVVSPQLKNVTVIQCYGNLLISAPGLTSLVIKNDHPLQLSTEGLCSLEKVDLCIFDPLPEDAHEIVCLLQQLQSVKFVTLNLQILELLSSSMGLMSHQPSPFPNLTILKFLLTDPPRVYLEAQSHVKATTSTETKNYVQDTSPSSVFTMVSCEELRVMRDIVTARKLVARVRLLLEQHNNARIEQANAPVGTCKRKMHEVFKGQVKKQWTVQSALEMQWHFGEIMAEIKQGKLEGLLTNALASETCDMILWLQRIEGLLIYASNRHVMQEAFTSVCEEAAIVSNKILDRIKKARNLYV